MVRMFTVAMAFVVAGFLAVPAYAFTATSTVVDIVDGQGFAVGIIDPAGGTSLSLDFQSATELTGPVKVTISGAGATMTAIAALGQMDVGTDMAMITVPAAGLSEFMGTAAIMGSGLYTVTASIVTPLPAAGLLFAAGVGGLYVLRRRKGAVATA